MTPQEVPVRILLVEDNEFNADMLTRRLTRRGFVISRAADGLQAVALARQERPDIILMDMSLPEIDGWEATRRIKSDRDVGGTPIIALTAHAMVSDRERALAAGCDEFETKPVDLDHLLKKIALLVGVGAGRE
ncbi:MAG: response regulator [Acidobacteriota bacterium]